jgi:hypothetical protein
MGDVFFIFIPRGTYVKRVTPTASKTSPHGSGFGTAAPFSVATTTITPIPTPTGGGGGGGGGVVSVMSCPATVCNTCTEDKIGAGPCDDF